MKEVIFKIEDRLMNLKKWEVKEKQLASELLFKEFIRLLSIFYRNLGYKDNFELNSYHSIFPAIEEIDRLVPFFLDKASLDKYGYGGTMLIKSYIRLELYKNEYPLIREALRKINLYEPIIKIFQIGEIIEKRGRLYYIVHKSFRITPDFSETPYLKDLDEKTLNEISSSSR